MSTEAIVKLNVNAPIANGTNVQTILEQYRRAFEIAAPQHLDVNRVMRVALMTVSRNKDLLECTATSLLGAFMLSVQLGLDIGAGECHLVPFRNKHSGKREIQLIPDFKGVAKLIRNAGVTSIRTHVVYKQDYFEYEEGMNPKLIHRPALDGEELQQDIIGAYSIAQFASGYVEAHFVSRRYIDKVKHISKATDGPWIDHYAEMARKTVLKNHSKTLPRSVELATAITLDNRAEMAKPQEIALRHSGDLLMAEIPPETEAEPVVEIAVEDAQPKTSAVDRIVDQRKKTPTVLPPPDTAGSYGEISPIGGTIESIPRSIPRRVSVRTEAPAGWTDGINAMKPIETVTPCDRSDFDQLEILGTECRVFPRKWRKHVEETMGFASWELLTKERLPEVRAWIEAQKELSK